MTVRALDMNRNSQIDYAGNIGDDDRIVATAYSVVTENGTTKIRQTVSEWQTEDQDVATVVSVSDQSATSLESWSTQVGLTTYNSVSIHGNGDVTKTTINPDGSSSVELQSSGQTIETRVLDADDVQISKQNYAYDAHGRLASETDARNGTTDYTYFDNDQVETITLPPADATTPRQVREFTYDEMGRVIFTKLPDNSVQYSTYYLTGELQETGGSQTYTQEYTYDSAGRRKTLTTAGDRTTTWNYDPKRGWLTSKLDDNGEGTTYAYTPGGRLSYRDVARQYMETLYYYNSAGDVVFRDYFDGITALVSLNYNRRGLLSSVSDAAGDRTFTYNAAGQVVQEAVTGGTSLNYEQTLTYSYDAFGRKSYVHHSPPFFGNGLLYSYDGASRLETIAQVLGGADGPRYTYEYEANSNVIKSVWIKDHNDIGIIKTSRQYDNLNRLTSTVTKSETDNSTLAAYHYTYNSLNQRERVEHADATYWQYGYDSLGQVVSGEKKLANDQNLNGYDYGYQFDGIGNRISASVNSYTQTYTANNLNQYTQRTVPGIIDVVGEADPAAAVTVNSQPATQQGEYFHGLIGVNNTSSPQYPLITVTADNGTTSVSESGNVYVPKTPEQYTYDLDGNMLSDGRWNYTWDCENRLIGMESIATVPAEAKRKITYHYDYMSRRIAKRVDTWDAPTSSWQTGPLRKFHYDGWNLFAETEGGVLKADYVWGLDLSGSLQGAGGVGGLLSVRADFNQSFTVADGNGNVTKLVRPVDRFTVETVADYEYGPFGELIRMTGPAAKANPFRFSTKYQEPESGLLYYGYRFYNPTTGRWINRDPIGEEGGLNLLDFLKNDGINRIDVLGAISLPDLISIARAKGWPTLARLFTRWGTSRYVPGVMQSPDETTVRMSWILTDSHSRKNYNMALSEGYKSVDGTAALRRNINYWLTYIDPTATIIDFTAMTPRENFEQYYYINKYDVSTGSLLRPGNWNDVQASLHSFSFYLAGRVRLCQSKRTATLSKVGVYAKDSFDFSGNQPLGFWGHTAYVSIVPRLGAEWISNAWFRNYQSTTGWGSDFLIYSNWRKTRVPKFTIAY